MRNKTKRFAVSLGMLAAIAGLCCACGKKVKNSDPGNKMAGTAYNLTENLAPGQVETKEIDEKFLKGYNDFSMKLFQKSVAEAMEEGGNALISPESMMLVLSLAANGADGETAAQMQTLLGDISQDELNQYLAMLQEQQVNTDTKFNIANSIWMKENSDRITVKEEFLQKGHDYFHADVYRAPFTEETVTDINAWVSEKTDGMIPTLINEISEDTVLYLLNAVSFESEWENPYEEYQINEEGTFTNSKGQQETVAMLSSEENMYIENNTFKGFVKPYKGENYAFMALLPKDEGSLLDVISNMDGEMFGKLYNENRERCKVYVDMPEFSYDFSAKMKDVLIELGMELAFTKEADFTKLAEVKGEAFFISSAIHKTFISVDRSGTKAAAASGLGLDCTMAAPDFEEPKEVKLDRPFIYSIVDLETGLPIFVGAVNTVE